MEIAMKIYLVQYHWEDIVEVIYEYVISNCEDIFAVVNQDCVFRIEPDKQKRTIMIGLIHDEAEQFFIDYLTHNDLENTGMSYLQLFNHSLDAKIKKTNKYDFLASNESRYIKLNYNEISRLLITIVAQQLKLKKFFSVMIQENSELYTIYLSKSEFEYDTIKNGNSLLRLVDKTANIVGKFV